jgi:hypothetical protein
MNPIRKLTTKTKGKSSYDWEYRCPYCEKLFAANRWSVEHGRIKSCGCLRSKKGRTNYRDYTEAHVGFLHVIREVGVNENGLVLWECVCQFRGCGAVVIKTSELLRRAKSCGCWQRYLTRQRALQQLKGIPK